MSSPTPAPRAPELALVRYALGVGITVLAVLSQYFLPQTWPAARFLYDNLPGDLFVVYGIPIVAFLLLVGLDPLRQWRANLEVAAWEGLGWFGLLSIAALVLVIGLAIVYLLLDPSVFALLQRTNPALAQAQGDPWLYVGFSFAIGAIEETIFRGWIFGFWQHRPGSWLVPASWTSAVFAGVHLYYGTTYGLASPLIFPSLFLSGFAFAAAYRYSNGNLVVPALLHGQMDATAYLSLISQSVADAIHYAIILLGVIAAVLQFLGKGPAGKGSGPVGALVRFVGPGPTPPVGGTPTDPP
ncbi:MAG: lysostaphin resistance A-like protein [Thermoplasmata archaeon]